MKFINLLAPEFYIEILAHPVCKMQHLEGSGTPVLYIGRTVLKG